MRSISIIWKESVFLENQSEVRWLHLFSFPFINCIVICYFQNTSAKTVYGCLIKTVITALPAYQIMIPN